GDFRTDFYDTLTQHFQFSFVADQWHHDLRDDVYAFAGEFTRRFHDRARLGLVDFRERDPQATPAVPQHGVEFVQCVAFHTQPLGGNPEFGREIRDLFFGVREELVQRRVEQPDRDRQPGHRPENADEVALLHRDDLIERGCASGGVFGENHLAHSVDTVPL